MRKSKITMLTPAHDTSLLNLKAQLDISLDRLIGQQNTEDPGLSSAAALTPSDHGYEWEIWENQGWPGNESYLGTWKAGDYTFHAHASNQIRTFYSDQTLCDIFYDWGPPNWGSNRDIDIYYMLQLGGDGNYSMEGFSDFKSAIPFGIAFGIVEQLHFQFLGNSGNNTFTIYKGQNTVHMGAGGNNMADIRGGLSTVIAGAGDDTISISNDWTNPGHPGNWSRSSVDLSAGGNNAVDVSGNSNTSDLTIATIILGSGNDMVFASHASHVIIQGADSTGNDTISLIGTMGGKGTVYTGRGETYLTARYGDYDIYLGDGINTIDLSSWLGTSITVTFGSGIDKVFGHKHGMEFDLTGSNGGATLHLGAGQDQILIDNPIVSAPRLIYNFDFEQDSMTFGCVEVST